LQTQVNKLTARAVKCGNIEPAFITLLSFESGQSIYDLVYCNWGLLSEFPYRT